MTVIEWGLNFRVLDAEIRNLINHPSLPWQAEISDHGQGSTTWEVKGRAGFSLGTVNIRERPDDKSILEFSGLGFKGGMRDEEWQTRRECLSFLIEFLIGRIDREFFPNEQQNKPVSKTKKNKYSPPTRPANRLKRDFIENEILNPKIDEDPSMLEKKNRKELKAYLAAMVTYHNNDPKKEFSLPTSQETQRQIVEEVCKKRKKTKR